MSTSRFEPPTTALAPNGQVVVIDDDPDILDAFRRLLTFEGFRCDTYLSASAYLRSRETQPDPAGQLTCVVCDVQMPHMSGLDLQARLQHVPDVVFVLMSGSSGALEAVTGFRAGAVDFLLKPIDADQLLACVERALRSGLDRQIKVKRTSEAARLLGTLTPRELEVARLVAAGVTGLGVSLQLGISDLAPEIRIP
jgi:FixJ family two-component response regulator